MINRLLMSLFWCVILLIILNCGASVATLNINAVKNLNPGADGEPHPVIIKLYFLTQKANFESSDYNTLWSNPESILSSDLLGKPIPLEIAPEEVITDRKIHKSKDALYLGILAGYNDPAEGGWRKVIALSRKSVYFKLDEDQIRIQ